MSNNSVNQKEEPNLKTKTTDSNAEKDGNDRNINSHITKENNCKDSKNIITINNISICQFCNQNFNNKSNIPYLFKCGHFFCKNCVLSKFKDTDNLIKCPQDDTKVNSIDELKLLNNLLINDVKEANEKV
jgi:hypothetical protein